MPSPFSGMDPYLEGYLWPDVHQRLATEISRRLIAQLRPRYVARLEISVVEDLTPEVEIGIMYPDVEVVKVSQSGGHSVRETLAEYTPAADQPIIAPLTLPRLHNIEVRLVTVEIRDVAQNELITCIEILSPVNKREPGLSQYRRKQQRLYNAGIHLVEIDLLRRGTRSLSHPQLPDVPYLVALSRAGSGQVDVWPIHLQDPLPLVPIPLRPPDPDARLDLCVSLATIYDEAAYDLSIDYRQPPPPPPLSDADEEWMRTILETTP
jgi:hypothetical protein